MQLELLVQMQVVQQDGFLHDGQQHIERYCKVMMTLEKGEERGYQGQQGLRHR
jgi:hypothetical protein